MFGSTSPWVITQPCSRVWRNQVAFARPRRHARQQRDAGRAAVQRVAAALVERQLVEDDRRHDDRDRHLLIALGDEQRHRACRVRRRACAGSARSAAARCCRTTRRAPRARRPAGSGRPRPWPRAGTEPAWTAAGRRSCGARRCRRRPVGRSGPIGDVATSCSAAKPLANVCEPGAPVGAALGLAPPTGSTA